MGNAVSRILLVIFACGTGWFYLQWSNTQAEVSRLQSQLSTCQSSSSSYQNQLESARRKYKNDLVKEENRSNDAIWGLLREWAESEGHSDVKMAEVKANFRLNDFDENLQFSSPTGDTYRLLSKGQLFTFGDMDRTILVIPDPKYSDEHHWLIVFSRRVENH